MWSRRTAFRPDCVEPHQDSLLLNSAQQQFQSDRLYHQPWRTKSYVGLLDYTTPSRYAITPRTHPTPSFSGICGRESYGAKLDRQSNWVCTSQHSRPAVGVYGHAPYAVAPSPFASIGIRECTEATGVLKDLRCQLLNCCITVGFF